MPDEPVAVVDIDVEKIKGDPKKSWEEKVRERCRDKCSNCGGTDRLKVGMIVPVEAGGQYVESNGCLVCRACEMASEAVRNQGPDSDRRPLNFWVSRRFYDSIQHNLATKNGFRSMGSLVRYLMSTYVGDESRFDDLTNYQDSGANVKINVWVSRETYAVFKGMLDKRGVTVTDAVKALVMMYEDEAAPVVRRKKHE